MGSHTFELTIGGKDMLPRDAYDALVSDATHQHGHETTRRIYASGVRPDASSWPSRGYRNGARRTGLREPAPGRIDSSVGRLPE